MMYLRPKHSRPIPDKETRAFQIARNLRYTPENFDNYTDWFYFIHIDPYTRALHAAGMVIGVSSYILSLFLFMSFGFYLDVLTALFAGAFFFYVFPLLSHYLYDGGGAKSTPDKFLPTLLPVIQINLMTLTGRFDPWLREFVKKYPFTVEAWALEEVPADPRDPREG
jgi:hypothetical protein